MTNKYINLNHKDRFIDSKGLIDSYVKYEKSLSPLSEPYLKYDNGLELGIVSSDNLEISKGISSILTRSLEDAKNSKGGYLPDKVVQRVQKEIISPYGVSKLWGKTGHRFILSKKVSRNKHEIIATALIGKSKDTIFFFTGKYNNISHSKLEKQIDLDLPLYQGSEHKWFDQFAFPKLEKFKPLKYHQIANFVVTKEHRGKGYSSFLLDEIIKNYSKSYLDDKKITPSHSQHLLCGKGLWQIGDPPWKKRMEHLNFYLRSGAEHFFIEQEWSKLPPIYKNGKKIENDEYNSSFELLKTYQDHTPSDKTNNHLIERIPTVLELSKSKSAKLQYFHMMRNFI